MAELDIYMTLFLNAVAKHPPITFLSESFWDFEFGEPQLCKH